MLHVLPPQFLGQGSPVYIDGRSVSLWFVGTEYAANFAASLILAACIHFWAYHSSPASGVLVESGRCGVMLLSHSEFPKEISLVRRLVMYDSETTVDELPFCNIL